MKSLRILEERAIAEGKVEGRAVGREEGRIEACENVALGLIRLGKIAFSDIASVCNLSSKKYSNSQTQ